MCVFVYGLVLENGELVPKLDRPGNGRYLDKRVTLLRLEDSENGLAHYCYVKSLDRLMHTHKYSRDKNCYMCHYCEKNVPLETYEQHLRDCYRIVEESGALLEMPEEGAVMEFKSWQNTFMLPCFGSADFEACVVKEVGVDIETIKQRLLNDKDREEDSTINIARHEPNSVGFNFVDTKDFSKNYYTQFSGDNFLTEWFI